MIQVLRFYESLFALILFVGPNVGYIHSKGF